MRISTAGTLAALAATVNAFADTAPFIVFGSEEYVDIIHRPCLSYLVMRENLGIWMTTADCCTVFQNLSVALATSRSL